MQAWQHDIPTRYFASYETLEAAFRRRVGGLVPRFHGGPRLFWDDFQRLYHAPAVAGGDRLDAYITSNPRDCLAFGTPLQVLRAAWLSASRRSAAPVEEPEETARRFGLDGHLHQSIRSLSGGETVRLALAKAYLLAACAERLTVASPFSWLAPEHWDDFRRLAERCRSRALPLDLFALEGEDDLSPALAGEFAGAPELSFAWRFHDLRLELGSPLDRLHGRAVRAAVAAREETLTSPCLLCGDNGQGKSLVAKALAGAVAHTGQAAVSGPAGPLRARLLFQDVLHQTLMRTVRQMTPAGMGDGTADAYDAILAGIRDRLPSGGPVMASLAERRRDRAPLTLLEIKVLLVAARLARPGAMLILDEPDWGLSRRAALAFVGAVVTAAHTRQAPVVLISHKPWWHGAVGSLRWVRKETTEAPSPGEPLFRVRIADLPGGVS